MTLLSDLYSLIQTQGYALYDGATGTNLFDRGLTSGDAPELWNLERPDVVLGLHREWIAAGSDLILTNTFGGNRQRLKLHHAQDQVFEINKAAAELARQAAQEAERPVFVVGSIGPSGDLMTPLGPLSHTSAVDVFIEQGSALIDGGADFLSLETLSASEEMAAALEGLSGLGAPLFVTLSFDTNGRTMMGLAPSEFGKKLKDWPAVVAMGANCGTGPSELVTALQEMAARTEGPALTIAKANCGIPSFQDGKIVYSGTPDLMSSYACQARKLNTAIIGGCCGTKPEHIAIMKAALDAYDPASVELPDPKDNVAESRPKAFSSARSKRKSKRTRAEV